LLLATYYRSSSGGGLVSFAPPSYLPPPTTYLLLPTSYLLLSYFLPPTSHFLLPTSCHLLPTSCSVLPPHHSPLTTHHSPLTTHHPPLTPHHAPSSLLPPHCSLLISSLTDDYAILTGRPHPARSRPLLGRCHLLQPVRAVALHPGAGQRRQHPHHALVGAVRRRGARQLLDRRTD
jgi:hypothetical protein